MKRICTQTLVALAALVLFGGLVYGVLLTARVAEPATVTVHGPTTRRLWATAVVILAMAGVVVGGLAMARPTGRFGTAWIRVGGVVVGVIAAVNGGLVLAMANGGPGAGNGVVGGAAALVLGLIAAGLGGIALARSRHSG